MGRDQSGPYKCFPATYNIFHRMASLICSQAPFCGKVKVPIHASLMAPVYGRGDGCASPGWVVRVMKGQTGDPFFPLCGRAQSRMGPAECHTAISTIVYAYT